jgi:hypothetical protein
MAAGLLNLPLLNAALSTEARPPLCKGANRRSYSNTIDASLMDQIPYIRIMDVSNANLYRGRQANALERCS